MDPSHNRGFTPLVDADPRHSRPSRRGRIAATTCCCPPYRHRCVMLSSATDVQATIYAVSSPPGQAPRGLLRLSGPEAFALLIRLTGEATPVPRTLTPVRVRLDPDARLALPALAACFPGPGSYTGDDLAELQVPGQPALLQRLQEHLRQLGGRLAEPGEFTYRAFLAGKLDLTQAEGIAASITAVGEAQLRAANLLRQGRLGDVAERLVQRLADALALVEAGIDFVDQEDVVAISPAALAERLEAVRSELGELRRQSRSWSTLQAEPRVVLAGPPSAGKSTLFNALLGRRRAVMHAVAGTTRDVLVEPLRLLDRGGRPVEVLLVDLAGLDEPRSALDRAVQRQAREAIESADLRLSVRADDRAHGALPGSGPLIRVRSQADRATNPGEPGNYDVAVSGVTGEGLDALRERIAALLADRVVGLSGESLALQPRHEAALAEAAEAIDTALAWVLAQRKGRELLDAELIAGSMRAALDALAALGGRMSPDDVIGRVFATFCCGK